MLFSKFLELLFLLFAFASPSFTQNTTSQPLLQPQPDTWNSTATLTPQQIAAPNISNATVDGINVALQFERTNWATGSVLSDTFYTSLPRNTSTAPPGSLLKLQGFVNTSTYTLAPALALSRIVYQSATLNNTPVPASAYILWPTAPRSHGPENKIPLVAWGHGSSGQLAECAPSHIRNLWYAYTAPFTIALAGYAVVAPDYVGLGVPFDAAGNEIVNEALITNPASANDMVYAVQAAQAAFSQLSRDFVVVGHSQGGGAAWAVAQRQVTNPVPGYLGAVVGSPETNTTRRIEVQMLQVQIISLARGIVSAFSSGPSISDILTAQGRRILNLVQQVNGCNSVLLNTLLGLTAEATATGDPSKLDFLNQSFWGSYWHQSWQSRVVAGGREVAGPMLIVQGTVDTTVPEIVTTEAVNKTCEAFPESELEYLRVEGLTHAPVMYATQRIWLQWIADRFAGRNVTASSCEYSRLTARDAPRPLNEYSPELTYFLEFATQGYQVG